jgi:tripeptide aminopeptidase
MKRSAGESTTISRKTWMPTWPTRFSADKADVHVQGVSIHPGQAKDKLVNAIHLAAKIIDTMPQVRLTPETTSGREGFIHIYEMSGTAASAHLHFILRDFELDGLHKHGELLRQVCSTIQSAEPRARITCTISQQYRNMRYWLEKDMRPVELAQEACRSLGIEPISQPIRGGTDGSRLTERGVPTPNLFTGMQNIHGPQEWISVQDMACATEMCVALAQLWSTPKAFSAVKRNGDARLTTQEDFVDWAG